MEGRSVFDKERDPRTRRDIQSDGVGRHTVGGDVLSRRIAKSHSERHFSRGKSIAEKRRQVKSTLEGLAGQVRQLD